MEALVDVEIDHGPVVDTRLVIVKSKNKEAEEHGREGLHLSIREILSKAYPWTSLEMKQKMNITLMDN